MVLFKMPPAFVMHCVYRDSHSFLLIEFTDSMIYYNIPFDVKILVILLKRKLVYTCTSEYVYDAINIIALP